MASTYLTYTQQSPSTVEGQKFTLSMWVKKCQNGASQGLYGNTYSNTHRGYIYFKSNDQLSFYDSSGVQLTTTRVFRDPTAWYHIVVSSDTTQGTASDRMKFYVNGVQETSFATANYPGQNDTTKLMNTTNTPNLGRLVEGGSSDYFDGVLSHVHLTQGYTYDATPFGETDSTTGEWKIKTSPTGITYGTNGFFVLKDGNSVTDQSGNSNNFTVGAGSLTKTEDSPSNIFATGNVLIGRHSNGNDLLPSYSQGALTAIADGSAWKVVKSTLAATSGKYYAEFKWISDSNTRYSYVGVYNEDDYAAKATGYPYLGDLLDSHSYYSENGNYYTNAGGTSFGSTFSSSGDGIVGVAMDLDNSKVYFSSNGSWQGSGDPTNGTGGKSLTAGALYSMGLQIYAVGNIKYSINFGNGYFGTTAVSSAGTNASGLGIFEYDVPTGFTALCTKGLNE